MLLDNERSYNTRSSLRNTIKTSATCTSTLRATFFSLLRKRMQSIKWMTLRKVQKKFKKTLIKVIRTKENPVFRVSEFYGIKLLTRLRLNFSHLNEHKFRHNFNDMINPMCNYIAAIETTIHYLLRCRLYSVQRVELLDGVYKLDSTPQNSSEVSC